MSAPCDIQFQSFKDRLPWAPPIPEHPARCKLPGKFGAALSWTCWLLQRCCRQTRPQGHFGAGGRRHSQQHHTEGSSFSTRSGPTKPCLYHLGSSSNDMPCRPVMRERTETSNRAERSREALEFKQSNLGSLVCTILGSFHVQKRRLCSKECVQMLRKTLAVRAPSCTQT